MFGCQIVIQEQFRINIAKKEEKSTGQCKVNEPRKIKWFTHSHSHSHLMPEAGNLLIFNDIECLSPIKLNEP